jgi:hypothetical protein
MKKEHKLFFANLVLYNFDLILQLERAVDIIKETNQIISTAKDEALAENHYLKENLSKAVDSFADINNFKFTCLQNIPFLMSMIFGDSMTKYVKHKNPKTDEEFIENSLIMVNELSKYVKEQMKPELTIVK